MNPILPTNQFVPDVEAKVWEDGKLYLYGSLDRAGDDTYCSYEYNVYRSEDLLHWEKSEKVFSSSEIKEDKKLFAPDCLYKDGTYYLFFA